MIDESIFNDYEIEMIHKALEIYPYYEDNKVNISENYVGKKYNFLKILYRTTNIGNQIKYVCLCDCGNICAKRIARLKNGTTKSCGCYRSELVKNKNKHFNKYDITNYSYGIGYTINDEKFYFDIEDYDLIKNYSWYINKGGYVVSSGTRKEKCVYLHRLLLNVTNPKILIDHINHDKVDNRKINLRIVTPSMNQMNRKSNGIYYSERLDKWCANIKIFGKTIYLGVFKTKEEAKLARMQAEDELYKENSYYNSIKAVEKINNENDD